MKLTYLANIRMPTEKAHGIQIMEMCQAFADLGHETELVVPNRRSEIKEDPYAFYGIRKNFKIRRLWCLDTVRFGRVGFWIEAITFAERVGWHALNKSGLFYSRDELIACLLKLLGKRVVWESHLGRQNIFTRYLIASRTPIVVISEGLKEVYLKAGARESQVLVAHDAADVERFNLDLSQAEARRELGLPEDKKIVLYKGHLYPYNGVYVLGEAIEHLKRQDVLAVFIGGTADDVAKFKERFGNSERIRIMGHRPRKETPVYQKAADILVIPSSATAEVTNSFASPMKLFGYMASKVPIIASDLPALREVLSEENAFFAKPDDAADLAGTLEHVLENAPEGRARADKAFALSLLHTWRHRAESILTHIV